MVKNIKISKKAKLFALLLLGVFLAIYFVQPIFSHQRHMNFLLSMDNIEQRFSPGLLDKIKTLPTGHKLDKLDKGYRVVFTVRPDFFAETNSLYRLGRAAEQCGWEWIIIDNADKHAEATHFVNPDFVIAIRSDMLPVPGLTNMLIIHSFLSQYVDKNGTFYEKEYSHLLKYNAFLEMLPNLDPIKAYFTKHNVEFKSTKFYLSTGATDFSQHMKNKLCFWGSALWDKVRGSERYMQLYSLLDSTDYFVLYGPESTWSDKGYRSYKGKLPIENNGLIKGISDAGIALVLHSEEHRKEGVPTGRIFEAAAAATLIICDDHPFVKEHFGDNVLYIDQESSAEEMFRQIDEHVKWAHENQEEAIKKAKSAHSIFLEKFTLEKMVQDIGKFYEEIK